MGIIDISKRLNEYSQADTQIISLANKLLEIEQNNVTQLKCFL